MNERERKAKEELNRKLLPQTHPIPDDNPSGETLPMTATPEAMEHLTKLVVGQETRRQKMLRQVIAKLHADTEEWPTIDFSMEEVEFLQHQLEVDVRDSEDALRKLNG
jgi:hypothetical protein